MKNKNFIIILSLVSGLLIMYFIYNRNIQTNDEVLDYLNQYYIKGTIESVYRHNNTVYFIKAKVDSCKFYNRQSVFHIDLVKGLISPDSSYIYVRTQVSNYPRKEEINLNLFPNIIVLDKHIKNETIFYRDTTLYEIRKLRTNYNYSTDRAFERKIIENKFQNWLPF